MYRKIVAVAAMVVLMAGCSTDEPTEDSTTASDILMGPWAAADQEQRDTICEGYYIDPDYTSYTLSNQAGVSHEEADDFLSNMC